MRYSCGQRAGTKAHTVAWHSFQRKARFKVTTDSRRDLPIAPNLLDREFTVAELGKVWMGDITYIAKDKGWLL